MEGQRRGHFFLAQNGVSPLSAGLLSSTHVIFVKLLLRTHCIPETTVEHAHYLSKCTMQWGIVKVHAFVCSTFALLQSVLVLVVTFGMSMGEQKLMLSHVKMGCFFGFFLLPRVSVSQGCCA